MKRKDWSAVIGLVGVLVGLSVPGLGSGGKAESAQELVHRAAQAMGGEEQLGAIHAVRLKAIGHRYMLEQSERPEGPWLLDYFQIEELRDFEHGRARRETRGRGCNSSECWKSAEWSDSAYIVADHVAANVAGAKIVPGRAATAEDEEELLALAPERVLLLAAAAPDLHTESDISFHGFTHHIVAFSWESNPVRLLLSSYTGLPSAIEVTRRRPYDVFWSPWGDVTTRISFAFWMLEPGGLHYPREWVFESNGQPDWSLFVNEVAINPTVKEEDFAIPADVAKTFAEHKQSPEDWPLGLPSSPAQELAPGVVQVPGRWNVEEVRQDDGILILEGPISNGYSARVIEDAQKRFPGLPVKAVISTSDAWPHIGGLREYVARGIPIYALDLNRPILERLFAAPHRFAPDALGRHPKSAKVTYVSARTRVGTGPNAVELIPWRTVTGERQMAVYFPARKLLYSSDLFQRDTGNEFFLPQTLSEAVEAVHREKIEVETDLGMHLGPTAWKEIEGAVAAHVGAAGRGRE